VNENQLFDLASDLPEWATKPIAVFDLETTGLDHRTARIVTACAALIDQNGQVIGNDVEWLANPGVPIPAEATAVHGITNEIAMARGADLREVVTGIIETLSGYFNSGVPVVAYNAPYDFTILRQHAEDFGIDWPAEPMPIIDPLVLDKKMVKFRKGNRRLETVAGIYSVNLDDAHNATADAIAAGHVAQALARAFPKELSVPLPELHKLQVAWSEEQDRSFADFMHKSGKADFQLNIGWPEKLRN
jgi:DNA polymerase-3 subunit epsilon